MLQELHAALLHVELDRDVNAAVIDGSWPSAEEVLRHKRHRAYEIIERKR